MARHEDEFTQVNAGAGLNNLNVSETTPHSSRNPSERGNSQRQGWRSNPSKDVLSSKYQLWPITPCQKITSSGRSTPDIERAIVLSIERSTSLPKDNSIQLPGRSRTNDVRGIRKRKVSVPELGLGPMTTVQEAAMDSPTIPGRPPVHERSNSSPSWRDRPLGDAIMARITGPMLQLRQQRSSIATDEASEPSLNRRSKESLTPLVIPTRKCSPYTRLPTPPSAMEQADNVPPEVPPKSPRMKDWSWPRRKESITPVTASSSSLENNIPSDGTPKSSACEGRNSPKPWNTPLRGQSPTWHERRPSEASGLIDTSRVATPVSMLEGRDSPKPWTSPTRGDSPSRGQQRKAEKPIMDRGRPMTRNEIDLEQKLSSLSNRSQSASANAFHTLPVGHRPVDATSSFSESDICFLQTQAMSQTESFEVLSVNDVKLLSRELRALDERCEYLRKTHTSLRSGRRSLHARMISYLKSPRMAVFSRENVLKQEEALAELDLSIDDWVSKLERAENRRTRVRQKLLEHVAAALTLKNTDGRVHKSAGQHTPPTSPGKATCSSRTERREVESIKIYADSDVYQLMEDVQQEIEKMVEIHI
ncbi:MAG: hypothetical protein M1827_004977 [Pycnora praestabilis]|nr:MAG: hypothetical protein M1827_004977 [Pycnora praestabilis]